MKNELDGKVTFDTLTIYKLVRKNNYQYVLRTSQQPLAAVDLLAARIGGAKKLIYRSSNAGSEIKGYKGSLNRCFFGFLPKIIANVKIAPSTEAAEYVFGKNCISKGKATLIPNALNLELYKFDEKMRTKIRNELSVENKKVIGHIGRFNAQKNHDFLIEVFSKIKEICPESVLILVGKGELEEKIRDKVKSRGLEKSVIFCGIRSDIPNLLSAMDLLLFPSYYEGMPNVVLEAQATGLKCLISDSITPEVCITDFVKRKSLRNSAYEWAREAVEMIHEKNEHRTDQHQMIEEGYAIQKSVDSFTKIVFGD